MFHRFKNNERDLSRLMAVMEDYSPLLDKAVQATIANDGKSVDPTDLLNTIAKKHGKFGLDIANELLIEINATIHRSPWTVARTIEWKDERALLDLFTSENLDTDHGLFFDQRFIDYLEANFDKIGDVNWRQFEGMTAEYLARQGFSVELGSGRNDGGVDIRVYPTDQHADLPPTMIVQCKRERRKISKVIVKSLWADLVYENANSGLIVTTTELSPGAKKVCKARNYPIEQANREILRHWISNMRTPGAGVFG